MTNRFTLRTCLLAMLGGAMAACLAGCGAQSPDRPTPWMQEHGIEYWLVVRQQPRPLRIHHLRIDLANPHIEVAAVLGDDPDGPGPATAQLTSPLTLAQRSGAIALVNANPWQSLPDASGQRTTNWQPGMPVETLGLAVSQGQLRSKPLDAHCAFWIDTEGRPHIGQPGDLGQVRVGVAGFAQLVRSGKLLPPPQGPIHPRTALGLDRTGRWLYLVVVDGRQSGYSEGMANLELAAYMRDLGCHDAANLDGGGSSIMMLAKASKAIEVVNSPSTKLEGISVPRPIPVAIAIRPR